jgi:TM2 domain-containing membrane protein YozV
MSIRGWTKRAVFVLASLLLGGASLIAFGVGGVSDSAGAASPHLVMNAENFPDTTLGTYSPSANPSVLSNSGAADTIDLNTDVSFSGPGADDYVITPGNCSGDGVSTIVLQSGQSCTPEVNFYPGALGSRAATMTIQGSADASPVSVSLTGNGTIGYYEVDSYGNVVTAGDASYYGDAGSDNLNRPIVGMAATGDDGGYWLVASDGGIFTFGDARYLGSTGAIDLNKPIVGMAATSDDGGYWMVASDGGIFSFGDARFYGSTGAIHLNKPIVGMAPTSDGKGYWLVASDGGIFSFGDAQFYGSTGAIHLNKPIVGMAPTPDSGGYWLVASDGGIFSFGDAQFYGSTGAIHLNQPIVAMAPMPTGDGYWFAAADGGLFNFGDAPFDGSGAGTGLGQVVDMATDGAPTAQAQADIPAIRAHLAGLDTSVLRKVPRFAGS